jgi:DNA-binding NarL/FixJ family response regulator
VRETLEDLGSIQVVGEAADGRSALKLALELNPDVVLMDVSMPGLDGIEVTRRLLAQSPNTRVLAFSMDRNTETIQKMFDAGARGYLIKTDDPVDWVVAVQKVLAGEQFVGSSPKHRSPGRRPD